ncbi:uncharacterized protein LOC134722336 [Mytilus trossulus]|uniref:uncharacterized protein LOC134722336 n=1 Tax=Mytilus trossulus TaxID=6551 RepID=UPI0030059CA5
MAHLCKLLLGFILVHIVAAGQSQEELCATVTKINCNLQYSAEPNEIVCGNDGKTYSNRCLYAQAKCHNNGLEIKCKGHCSQCMIGFKANTKPSSVSTNTPGRLMYRKTTKKIIDGVTPRRNAYKIKGRKLQESTNSSLTGENSTIMGVEERLNFRSDNNITRTRKQLPGHHIAESTENTNGSQEVQGAIEKPLCENGLCNSTQKIKESTESSILSIIQTTTEIPSIETIMTTLDMIVPTTTEKVNVPTSTQDDKNKDVYTVSSTTTQATKNVKSINLKTTKSVLISLLKTSSERSTRSQVSTTTSQITPQITDLQFPTEIDFVLFCTDVDSKVCPKTLDPLCGTDNQFYLNLCTFNKSKCKDKTLMLRDDLSSCRQIKQ